MELGFSRDRDILRFCAIAAAWRCHVVLLSQIPQDLIRYFYGSLCVQSRMQLRGDSLDFDHSRTLT